MSCYFRKPVALCFAPILCLALTACGTEIPSAVSSAGDGEHLPLGIAGSPSVISAEPSLPENILEKYLSENNDYIEPVYEKELENGQAVFETEKLYQVLSDGTKQELLPYPAAGWAIVSEHTLLVTQGDTLVKVDTDKWQVDIMYEHDRPITSLNTNGTLVFFTTDTQVYRYFIPTGEVSLIAEDDMLISIFSPISTTEILWTAYNPLWLKKYYKEHGLEDNIYNVYQTLFVFHDTETGKSYRWMRQNIMDDVLAEGLEWYHQQRKN